MGRISFAALAALLLVASLASAAADDADRESSQGAQTYESPILSLLLLPVTMLIKMASVLGPEESGTTPRSTAASDNTSK